MLRGCVGRAVDAATSFVECVYSKHHICGCGASSTGCEKAVLMVCTMPALQNLQLQALIMPNELQAPLSETTHGQG